MSILVGGTTSQKQGVDLLLEHGPFVPGLDLGLGLLDPLLGVPVMRSLSEQVVPNTQGFIELTGFKKFLARVVRFLILIFNGGFSTQDTLLGLPVLWIEQEHLFP